MQPVNGVTGVSNYTHDKSIPQHEKYVVASFALPLLLPKLQEEEEEEGRENNLREFVLTHVILAPGACGR